MSDTKDALKQKYREPRQAILADGNDLIIVGRGIYEAADKLATARAYKEAAWDALLKADWNGAIWRIDWFGSFLFGVDEFCSVFTIRYEIKYLSPHWHFYLINGKPWYFLT